LGKAAHEKQTATCKRGARPAPWRVHFFQRHAADDPARSVPALEFLRRCPTKVEAMVVAVVGAVAEAPPPAFSGGGKWEAMPGEMAGFYEVRVDGPKRRHYRLFCVLERDGAAVGLGGPSLVLVTGKDKPFMTVLSAADYAEVRALGAEFRKRLPRSVLA
jgi:Txe/YoeB family toxin of Txe-Axe toxin-antitoxin module